MLLDLGPTTGEGPVRSLFFAFQGLKIRHFDVSRIPKNVISTVLVRRERTSDQLLRSGTSVGAHFREAQRAKSNPDFISKIEGGMQELEETAYWLELLEGARLCGPDQLEPLTNEADQLMAIFVTIVRKTKAGMAKRKL